ncbi:hypothetical protein GGU11DRAFT_349905 [Lentinula aff. detonsa]|nr:hypothetical protein GGU11DRAFT_349905 [Lentinula aff. detonsa]
MTDHVTHTEFVTFFPAALRRMLHLSLPANTTSFKRSFEQFGVDLEESPITGIPEPGGSSAENRASGSADNGSHRTGNERKRARSASSLSDGNESLNSSRSSTFTASSDTSLSEDNEPIAESSGSSSSQLVTDVAPLLGPNPPRLPTPDIQDIEMPDYEQETAVDTNTASSSNEYRFAIDELHTSHSETDPQRHNRSSSLHSRRSPTPPPTLPPLSLSEEEQAADIPFLDSPAVSSRSADRLSFTSSTSLPHREDLSIRELDAPPRLPSSVYDSSPTLSAIITMSDGTLDVENADIVDEAPIVDVGRYVSFRERLNTAVGLLEADDLSAFRERLTSALDAVRTDESEIQADVERSNLHGGSRPIPSNDRVPNEQAGPSDSRAWRSSILNNTRDAADASVNPPPRIRDLLSSSTADVRSSTTSPIPDSRLRPLYLASQSALLRPRDSFPRSLLPSADGIDDENRSNAFGRTFRAFEPLPTLSSHQQTLSQLPTRSTAPRQPSAPATAFRPSASITNPFNRELARWFEDPADSLPESISAPSSAHTQDLDDGWTNTASRGLGPRRDQHRIRESLPPWQVFLRRNNTSVDHSEDDDQDREDNIALTSTQERVNNDIRASAIGDGSSNSRGARVPPSLASLVSREYPFSNLANDSIISRSPDPSDSDRTERARELSAPRRYTDVLSLADQLADAQRRRYIDQGLYESRDSFEAWSSSAREQRRNTTSGIDRDGQPATPAGYRLTAHEMPEVERLSPSSVRWQFSWNDALSLDGEDDDAGRNTRDRSPLSINSRTSVQNLDSHRWIPRRLEESSDDDHQRLRSRPLASTRPSTSNSLVAENAAEIRRRNARADLMDHLFNGESGRASMRSTARDRDIDSGRSNFVGPRETFPSQQSLSYHHRSPSPPDYIRSIADVRDAADRELEEQERHSREEGLGSLVRRSTSSWLPPPQFGSDRSLSESLADHALPSDMDSTTSSGGRNPPISEIDWLRRRSRAMRRPLYPADDTHSLTQRSSIEPERSRPTMPLPRSHIAGSSWPSSNAVNETSSGFFDSRHSSITDIARTINDRSQTSTSAEFRTIPRTDLNDGNTLRRPLRAASSADRRVNPAPSIPPPDLGFFFPPNDSPIFLADDEPSSVRVPPRQSETHDFGSTSSAAAAPYLTINVDSFAPGPFRSTMQRLAEQNRLRNVPQEAPSIPPLSFEEDIGSLSEPRPYTGAGGTAENQDYLPRTSIPISTRETRMPSTERTPWPSRLPAFSRSSHRGPSRPAGEDIHEAINRRARPDGSTMENLASEFPSVDENFQHAIEILRQDGLSEQRSHQLTSRYRQRRDAFPTNSSWGDIDSDIASATFHRYAPWSMHGDVSSSDPAASASSTATNTNARMGNAATRRRPSPARNPDRPDGLDSRLNRPRTTSRFGRHRTSDIDREFAALSDLVGRSRRARGNFNLGDYMVCILTV